MTIIKLSEMVNVLIGAAALFITAGGAIFGLNRANRQEMRESVERAHRRIDGLSKEVAENAKASAVISSEVNALRNEIHKLVETLGSIQRSQEELLIAMRTGEYCPITEDRSCEKIKQKEDAPFAE